ncbi:MAG: hypothetical protein ACJAZW_001933 [Maritalea sp.]|jgi:hypothetical protein
MPILRNLIKNQCLLVHGSIGLKICYAVRTSLRIDPGAKKMTQYKQNIEPPRAKSNWLFEAADVKRSLGMPSNEQIAR